MLKSDFPGGLVQDSLGIVNALHFSALVILGRIGIFYAVTKQARRYGTTA